MLAGMLRGNILILACSFSLINFRLCVLDSPRNRIPAQSFSYSVFVSKFSQNPLFFLQQNIFKAIHDC